MRFIIYGAGAVGGVIGGRLFQADHSVTLIARGDHLRALQDRGLTLAAPSGTATLPIPAVGDPGDAELKAGDVVVLAMKGQHTQVALDDLRRAAPPGVAVVCAQNGVENDFVVTGSFDTLPPVPVIPIPENGVISPAPNQAFFTMPLNYPNPFVHSYNLTYQRELGAGLAWDIGYVGSLGRRIPYQRQLNAALPGAGANGRSAPPHPMPSPRSPEN